jgi:hypothetical protein
MYNSYLNSQIMCRCSLGNVSSGYLNELNQTQSAPLQGIKAKSALRVMLIDQD